jgi:hypothetical protein
MGEIGHASTIKVVTNMISAVTAQVLAEALSIVQKAGLEPELLTAAIEMNACRSGVIDLKLPKMMSGDYEPHFSLKHMFKDVQLGIHMANALDIEIPATTVTAGVMYGALNQGWGDLDFSVLFKNYAPSEIFEDLPALTHVLAEASAAAGAPAASGNEATSGSPDTEELSGSQGRMTQESAPAISEAPTLVVLEQTSVTVETSPSGINGNPVREAVPTEEAARIIEAVLAHVSTQRGELGAVLHENRSHAPKVDRLPVEAKAAVPEPEKGAEANPVPHMTPAAPTEEGADAAKTTETAKPGTGGSTLDAKPVNFVRRWFVGRSEG